MAEQENTGAADAKVKIDGVDYNLSDLSEAARAQVTSLRFVEGELARLNAQLALANTAKNAYLRALKEAIDAQ